jgi:hypothetical protein
LADTHLRAARKLPHLTSDFSIGRVSVNLWFAAKIMLFISHLEGLQYQTTSLLETHMIILSTNRSNQTRMVKVRLSRMRLSSKI